MQKVHHEMPVCFANPDGAAKYHFVVRQSASARRRPMVGATPREAWVILRAPGLLKCVTCGIEPILRTTHPIRTCELAAAMKVSRELLLASQLITGSSSLEILKNVALLANVEICPSVSVRRRR